MPFTPFTSSLAVLQVIMVANANAKSDIFIKSFAKHMTDYIPLQVFHQEEEEQVLLDSTTHADTHVTMKPKHTKIIPWSSSSSIEHKNTNLLLTIKLTLFWFGYQFTWFLITIVILPSQVSNMSHMSHMSSGDTSDPGSGTSQTTTSDKGSSLAIINLSSGLLYLIFSPIFGAINDKSKINISFLYPGHGHNCHNNLTAGHRKPWLLIGTFGMLFCLFLLNENLSLPIYSFIYLTLNLSSILCSIPFNGLIADLTHSSQNAYVSSIMGAMNLFGYLFGAIVGTAYSSISIYTLYSIISFVFLSSTLITCTIPIPPPPPAEQNHSSTLAQEEQQQDSSSRINYSRLFQEIISPLLKHPSFRLVFVSRFLFQLGIASIQSFLQYWIQDCVVDSGMDPTTAVSLAMIPNLLIAPIASLLTPCIAGSGRRKVVVYFSAACMTVACLLMMFTSQFSFAILVSSIFGLGISRQK